jgi:hypothetical protein
MTFRCRQCSCKSLQVLMNRSLSLKWCTVSYNQRMLAFTIRSLA